MTVGYGGTVAAGDIVATLQGDVLELGATGPDGEPWTPSRRCSAWPTRTSSGSSRKAPAPASTPDPMDREIIVSGLPGPGAAR